MLGKSTVTSAVACGQGHGSQRRYSLSDDITGGRGVAMSLRQDRGLQYGFSPLCYGGF